MGLFFKNDYLANYKSSFRLYPKQIYRAVKFRNIVHKMRVIFPQNDCRIIVHIFQVMDICHHNHKAFAFIGIGKP